MKFLILGEIQQTKWPPVGHFGSDPSQILHTDKVDDSLQVSYSLCIQIMIMGHTNYECSDFRPNSAKKNGRHSAIFKYVLGNSNPPKMLSEYIPLWLPGSGRNRFLDPLTLGLNTKIMNLCWLETEIYAGNGRIQRS